MQSPRHPSRKLTIIAQDPGVRVKGEILTAQVDVPAEPLLPGPRGYRVQVIDYDASSASFHTPARIPSTKDRFLNASSSRLLKDPAFHAQNVYAIAMRTLARFEFALGRRVGWGFSGHQLQIAPHAFAGPNAFYSPRDRMLAFGYFPGRKGTVYTCLSHDVVAHETAHALLDGLRRRYMEPSSPDQGAFHEGFSDLVALLSVFSLPRVVESLLGPKRLQASRLTPERLRSSVLFSLAEQMGEEIAGARGMPLRRSATLSPSPRLLKDPEFQEPHRRGEILVAAVMNAFLEIWRTRMRGLGRTFLDRERVAEEAATTASHLLTLCIRGLDYAPPTDILFSDFLSAILTADREIQPDDSRYQYRETLRQSFASYGIKPTSKGDHGVWEPPEKTVYTKQTHFESLQRSPEEVFGFLWENRASLGLYRDAHTAVQSVRPCLRIGPDGFLLRETVAEYVQKIKLRAAELRKLKIRRPNDMPLGHEVTLYGGGALIFNEFGQLKFHARNRIDNAGRQSARLAYLWENPHPGFAEIHRMRGSIGK
ncbi:MAG: hypothetical protein FJW20_03290 [Acidimicrobiia bacterium]|nr:hypothetical protein [Acidimicrobiia bacterium]